MSESFQLREFTLGDYDAVRALWEKFPGGIGIGRSDTREEIANKILRDPDLFLVAEERGRIIGTVIGGYDGRRGLIYHLAVDAEYQGHGIGRELMAEIERRLAAKGCLSTMEQPHRDVPRAWLVVKKTNLEVIEFYKQIGWEKMPVQPMAKNLK